MSDLIPLLWELDGHPGVPDGFVRAFVGLHDGGPGEEDRRDAQPWRLAQSHWEIVVADVLETEVIKPNESGEVAIRQAVRFAALVLNKVLRQGGGCPVCGNARPRLRRSRLGR
jgi:hypothetical protein